VEASILYGVMHAITSPNKILLLQLEKYLQELKTLYAGADAESILD